MNFETGAFFIVFGVTFMLSLVITRNDDMKVCQISHSYDVCFDALNR
jgi:hypothetical protein